MFRISSIQLLTLIMTTEFEIISVDLDGSATQYEIDAPGICAFQMNASKSLRQALPMWTVETMNCVTAPPNKNLTSTDPPCKRT